MVIVTIRVTKILSLFRYQPNVLTIELNRKKMTHQFFQHWLMVLAILVVIPELIIEGEKQSISNTKLVV